MDRYIGIIGFFVILGIAFAFSNNRKKINYRVVITGLCFQLLIAAMVLKIPAVNNFFRLLGGAMQRVEGFAKEGANFIYGGMAVFDYTGKAVNYTAPTAFVFAFNVTSTIILICVLVAILYHLGIMQRLVSVISRIMNVVMRVSGSEILSNVASAFVGQVEAQVMIRAYLPTMTKSELLASMSGSLACISGSILIVYANMGARTDYLIAASLMAAPGALVISKIVFPETEQSPTMGAIKLKIESTYTNLVDAITHGALDGFKISTNIMAILIGFLALIAFANWGLAHVHLWGLFPNGLSLNFIFSKVFYPLAWAMGVPTADVSNAASLLGQKLTINEFVAFKSLTTQALALTTQKGLIIVTIAICGFANFGSVGILIGGIGSLAPERRPELAQMGMKALLCGTLASYLSATIAGILL
jgi:concentrative nucleoside transporter, CNT family